MKWSKGREFDMKVLGDDRDFPCFRYIRKKIVQIPKMWDSLSNFTGKVAIMRAF